MATMNIYDMVDTWNDGATTFNAIKMNVTDTASTSSSLLIDLQVGGSSRFSVDKQGALLLGANQAPAVKTDVTGITGADAITNIVSLTQAEYDAITPDASTLYVIAEA